MRIGLLAPSFYMSKTRFPTRIFAPRDLAVSLADTLTDRGHTVTLFSTKDTKTQATLVPGDATVIPRDFSWQQEKDPFILRRKTTRLHYALMQYQFTLLSAAYRQAVRGAFDILHSFHSFVDNQHGAHYFEAVTGFPTIYTLHDPIPRKDSAESRFLQTWRHHHFVSISNAQRTNLRLHFVGTVHNGIPPSAYNPTYDDRRAREQFVWMGRILEKKGLDDAIQAVLRVNQKLAFAPSNIEENGNASYFGAHIRPFLQKPGIVMHTFVSGKKKSDFLRHSKAFLFPIHWNEPFGMTMIEAMACGTPVIAYDRGAVTEVIKDGVTGYVVPEKEGVTGLVRAMKRLDALSSSSYRAMRLACREHVLKHFTVEKMAAGYERVYRGILARTKLAIRVRT